MLLSSGNTPPYEGYCHSTYKDLVNYYSLNADQLQNQMDQFVQALETQKQPTELDSFARNLWLLWSYGTAQDRKELTQDMYKEIL